MVKYYCYILTSLLLVKNLNENITLREFYDETKIELIMLTVNLNNILPEKIKLSYKTHPELQLYKALYMSSCIPFVFKPVIDNNKCFACKKKSLPFVNVTFKSVGIEELSLNHLHEQPLKD